MHVFGLHSVNGYRHRDYARSLYEFGEPRKLANAGGWFLKRAIPGSNLHDGVGCYPLLSCRNWSRLPADLEELERELVTFTAVVDPLDDVPGRLLEQAFPDLVVPYKRHYLTELAQLGAAIDKQHARKARRALRSVTVARAGDPPAALDDWTRLYGNLVRKHGLVGLHAFSRDSFALQLRVPGLVLFEAREGDEVVAATMWYVDGERAYYHLGASSERGYALGASFALFFVALHDFAERGHRVALLGAGAGVHNEGADGLTRFKAGWATGTAQSILCGRIFAHEHYRNLSAGRSAGSEGYFPLYRQNAPGL